MMRFGATILDGDGLRLTADEVALFQDVNPFGFILSARNIDTPDQVRALCDTYREVVALGMPDHNRPRRWACPTTAQSNMARMVAPFGLYHRRWHQRSTRYVPAPSYHRA